MSNLKLEQLEQLVTFAECGTLLKTAEKLDVSQPTLSRSMKSLEDELGIKIFQRKKNRIILTEDGYLAVKYSKEVLNRVDNLSTKINKAIKQRERRCAYDERMGRKSGFFMLP